MGTKGGFSSSSLVGLLAFAVCLLIMFLNDAALTSSTAGLVRQTAAVTTAGAGETNVSLLQSEIQSLKSELQVIKELLMEKSSSSQNNAVSSSTTTSSNFNYPNGNSRLLTAGQMKERMQLPCNYVHDGYYVGDSNELLHQVYRSLMEITDDDAVPVFIEVGGHDGITKSLSLKASRCLHMNTLLIEASPANFNILQQTRGSYDITVHAALCDGESIQIVDNVENSGETKVSNTAANGVQVKCTTIDDEMDRLKETLPEHLREKLHIIMLSFDIEGHEPFAIDGITKYSPKKAFIEIRHLNAEHKNKIKNWAAGHQLFTDAWNVNDACLNFHHPMLGPSPSADLKELFYGARQGVPEHTWLTSRVGKSYMFYGE